MENGALKQRQPTREKVTMEDSLRIVWSARQKQQDSYVNDRIHSRRSRSDDSPLRTWPGFTNPTLQSYERNTRLMETRLHDSNPGIRWLIVASMRTVRARAAVFETQSLGAIGIDTVASLIAQKALS